MSEGKPHEAYRREADKVLTAVLACDKWRERVDVVAEALVTARAEGYALGWRRCSRRVVALETALVEARMLIDEGLANEGEP